MSTFYRRWFRGGIGVCQALRESVAWLCTLGREEAAAIVRSLPVQLKETLPEKAEQLKPVCLDAAVAIEAGPAQPFGSPEYWAAFFVAGDGSLTADGKDPRVPVA